jgi:hypothetical protein
VKLTDLLISIASCGGLLLCLSFIAIYLAYGNRLRKPAGRAFMIMDFGSTALFTLLVLRHPAGFNTDTDAWYAWLQVAGETAFCVGLVYLISIGVRANGRWPWQKGADE